MADHMDEIENTKISSSFTGVILPVFFVKDTLVSLYFYRDICGFTLKSFYDSELGSEVKEWYKTELPTFIRLAAADQELALHLNNGEFSYIGGNLHYFEVGDVDGQRRNIVETGGTPTEIADLPWMRLFSVIDPDGHKLFFQTPEPTWAKG